MELLRPTFKTMAQAPLPPWRTDDEKEEYAADPRTFLLERCAEYARNAKIMFNYVVCAVYYLPDFGELGGQRFYRAEVTHDAALWEGKVGLCIAKGPQAFKDVPEMNLRFEGQNVEIGEWVQWDIREGRLFTGPNQILCRRFKDVQVFATVPDPLMVY